MKSVIQAALLLAFAVPVCGAAPEINFDGKSASTQKISALIETAAPNIPQSPQTIQNKVIFGVGQGDIELLPQTDEGAAEEARKAFYVIEPDSHSVYWLMGKCGESPNGYSYTVCLSYQISAAPGGHNHSAGMPLLEFIYANYPQAFCRTIPVGTEVRWYFHPPAYGARFTTKMVFSGYTCNGELNNEVHAKVPGLIALTDVADSGYVLTGQTTPHPYNHQAMPTAITALRKIAFQYHQEFPAAPPLNYNDFSLVWGGLFDIGPRPSHPEWQFWNPPHSSHRWGWQADVEHENVPVANYTRLNQIFIANGARVLPEGDHWHLDFTPATDKTYEDELRCY